MKTCKARQELIKRMVWKTAFVHSTYFLERRYKIVVLAMELSAIGGRLTEYSIEKSQGQGAMNFELLTRSLVSSIHNTFKNHKCIGLKLLSTKTVERYLRPLKISHFHMLFWWFLIYLSNSIETTKFTHFSSFLIDASAIRRLFCVWTSFSFYK